MTDPATKRRIANMPTMPGVTPAGITEHLLEHCPKCKYPYASAFRGYEYVMVGQHVCNGSAHVGLCAPTVYIAVPAPIGSVEVDWRLQDKRLKGVLYEVGLEEE